MKRDEPVVPEGDAQEVIARLRGGGTTLRFEAKRLGIPHDRTRLRAAMVKVLGGEEAVTKLLAETHPTRNPFPG